MKSLVAVLVAASFAASSVVAAPALQPLPAGKPASVKQATLAANGVMIFLGVGLLIGGIALTVANNPSSGVTTPTTTGTGG